MCQSGYIYKVMNKSKYPHPFVFIACLQDDFLRLIDQFDCIDFSKYKKLHHKESRIYNFRNNYSWDGYNRIFGIKTKDTAVLQFENGIQIAYPHTLYDKLDQQYNRRLQRFLSIENKMPYFVFRVRKFMAKETVDKVYEIEKHKKIILFDQDVEFKNEYSDNEFNKIVITSKEHVSLVDYLKSLGTFSNF